MSRATANDVLFPTHFWHPVWAETNQLGTKARKPTHEIYKQDKPVQVQPMDLQF